MDRVLVVGGGITGIQASLVLARLGLDVTLVEREKEVGGKLKRLSTLFPTNESSQELLSTKLRELEQMTTIQVKTQSTIDGVTSKTSRYLITLKGEETPLEVGAVILATGFDPYDPSPIEEYGYGKLKDVITSLELEEMLRENNVLRPSDGNPPRKVAFLQCVGSRDRRTNRYCSFFCCTSAIKEALAIKEIHKETEVNIMYMDIRTPYLYEHLYTKAREAGIHFVRSRVSGISQKEDLLALDRENTTSGETETSLSDLVILSIGGIPSAGSEELANHFALSLSEGGFINVTDLPSGTSAAGVWVAGAASGLKDISHCLAEASAAALSATIFITQRRT